VQPFRYRGYVFDEETGLYYLRSRYYNAGRCRFLNADIDMGNYNEVLSTNLYLYCLNDPVNRIDEFGLASRLAVLQKRVVNMFTIALYSVLTQRENVHEAEIVTVSQMLENFSIMEKRKTDVSSSNDTGCAMYIRAAITGKLKRHSHHVYYAGMQPMFDNDLILQGEISDIGGVEGLMPGMILGSAKNKEDKIAHGGVYYGLHDFGDGYVPAVYSFNTSKKYGKLRPYNPDEWVYYGWHKGVILD
jgi:RHS repeat-associated protein